jgi:hypothetical protein
MKTKIEQININERPKKPIKAKFEYALMGWFSCDEHMNTEVLMYGTLKQCRTLKKLFDDTPIEENITILEECIKDLFDGVNTDNLEYLEGYHIIRFNQIR